MPNGGNHCKCATCFHTMPAQLVNRIASLERFESLTALFLPSFYPLFLRASLKELNATLPRIYCFLSPGISDLIPFGRYMQLIATWAALTSSMVGLTGCNIYFSFCLSVLYVKGPATWQALDGSIDMYLLSRFFSITVCRSVKPAVEPGNLSL